MLPFKGWQVYDSTLEATRQALNTFVRAGEAPPCDAGLVGPPFGRGEGNSTLGVVVAWGPGRWDCVGIVVCVRLGWRVECGGSVER